ncbi:SEC-C metal-binding domain-containing protein [Paenibacillus sp. UNC451MF]|uniref:SEC-C metal-binding domain-containing protein n=1 Tax=Paenibacillus sp. UNC451MF TaxID=1449063 RepID=UPI000A776FA4|nr:SEC-C metal-binding domain-containing protein [Paenibacillus sp. UNC451MF]
MMDKHLSETDQKMLLKEEEKRWPDIEVPVTLSDYLAKLTKPELSTIRMNLGIKGASSLKKQELIDVLVEQMPLTLSSLLLAFDEARYQILKQLADRGGQGYTPLESYQLDYFKKRGILCTGTYEGNKTLVMPQEVLACFKRVDSSSYRDQIRKNTEWIKLTHGLLYYYGVLSLNELERQMNQLTGTKIKLGEYTAILQEAVSFYEELQTDTYGYSNSSVLDADKVKNEQESRSQLPFFPFTKAQLLHAGAPQFVDRNASYQAFVLFIRKNYTISLDEADYIVEECVDAIRNDRSPTEVFKLLQQLLEINELDMVKAFMDHIADLHNNTRQWALKGYTPHQLSPAAESATAEVSAKPNIIEFAAKTKVGRNDPCPCGSGKKFKKCCGR